MTTLNKGKIEAANRTIKNEFQAEAARADFHTLEELNSAFWAWAEVLYNRRVHSATGESPDERFRKGLTKEHRRITDLESFNRLFLWKETRTVSKYGKIKLYSNQYPVQKAPHGTVVQVRFNPFELDEVYIYDAKNQYLETTSPSRRSPTPRPISPRNLGTALRKYQSRVWLSSPVYERNT